MLEGRQVLDYVLRGVETLIQRGSFPAGQLFRPTQADAFQAYVEHLKREDLSIADRLQWFFEIATGVGKTPLEISIVYEAQKNARQDGQLLRAGLVFPTRLLMNQTYSKIRQFAPDMLAWTGRYGDRHKQLDQDTTLFVSDSFLDLVETGEVSSKTHGIVIFDEGHNETSERRVENTYKYFDERTLRISVTATKDYDEEKSVELTHGKHGFSRHFPESVALGELSTYVRAQLHLIKVMPPTLAQEQQAAAKGITLLKYDMRKDAWSRFVVEHYKTGYDHQTGDPLSDNQAAIYAADIPHALKTAAALNNVSMLQHKAAAQGMKGVAAVIHSVMKPTVLRTLLKDVMAGHYLTTVMCDMGTEGFDLPFVKTLYDWNHQSSLLKRQIIGRAVRQWQHPQKNFRWEGATIIDTITYIGSAEPKRNRVLRNRAYMNAVTAPDIIGGTYVLGPGVAPRQKYPSGKKPPIIIDSGIEVESFETLEDIKTIHTQRQSWIERQWKNAPLRLADVKASIDAYKEAQNNTNPPLSRGDIEEGPLAGKATWIGINHALANGANGLSDDPDYQKWLEKEEKPSLFRYLVHLGYAIDKQKVTLEDIKGSINAYKEAKNKNPSQHSGNVDFGPLKGRATWKALQQVLYNGGNGLADDPDYKEWLKTEKTPSLYRYLFHLGYVTGKKRLTLNDVKSSIDAYRQEKNKNPAIATGVIKYGALAGKTTWVAVSVALTQGSNGLPHDPDYQELLKTEPKPTLFIYLCYLGYAVKTLTFADIKSSIEAHKQANNNKNPTILSGRINYGPLNQKTTWRAIDHALADGWNGLSADAEYQLWIQSEPKPSLFKLLKKIEQEHKRSSGRHDEHKPSPF